MSSGWPRRMLIQNATLPASLARIDFVRKISGICDIIPKKAQLLTPPKGTESIISCPTADMKNMTKTAALGLHPQRLTRGMYTWRFIKLWTGKFRCAKTIRGCARSTNLCKRVDRQSGLFRRSRSSRRGRRRRSPSARRRCWG